MNVSNSEVCARPPGWEVEHEADFLVAPWAAARYERVERLSGRNAAIAEDMRRRQCPSVQLAGLCCVCYTYYGWLRVAPCFAMQMRPIAYLCVALLTFNFVDDYLVPAPGSLTAPLAGDNDEYLSPTPGDGCQRPSARQEPVLAALKPRDHELPFALGYCPPQSDVAARYAPPPLYVFMSLQI